MSNKPRKSLTALESLTVSLHNSMAGSDIESLAVAVEKQGIVELKPGTKMQWGDKAVVIGISSSGGRCVRIMAYVPEGMVLANGGLETLYKEWIRSGNAFPQSHSTPIRAERAQAILLAAVLEGDVERANLTDTEFWSV